MKATALTRATADPDLPAALASLQAQLDRVDERLQRLERRRLPGRGPRDDSDLRLLLRLERIVGRAEFRTVDVLRRGELDRDVSDLLDAADARSIASLGYLLRRCAGDSFNGAALTAIRKDERGTVWMFLS